MKKTYLILSFIFLTKFIFSQVTFTDVSVSLGLNDAGNGQGAVFLDVDSDGLLDLYLVNNGQVNKLWKNNSGTGFTEIAASWGVNYSGPGRGVSAGDFDNDGNIDIMIGNFNALLILFKSTGSGFTNYTSTAGIALSCWGGSINWFDYNKDGKLDAMLGNDGVPYHYNYLFRNDNLSSFTNVAYTSGLTDSASTLCIATADIDNDNDMDVFCGSQTTLGVYGTGLLYRNNGNGTFTDITSTAAWSIPGVPIGVILIMTAIWTYMLQTPMVRTGCTGIMEAVHLPKLLYNSELLI